MSVDAELFAFTGSEPQTSLDLSRRKVLHSIAAEVEELRVTLWDSGILGRGA